MFLVQTENNLRLLLIIISIIWSKASFCALPNVSSRTQANEHGQDTRDDDHHIAVARRVWQELREELLGMLTVQQRGFYIELTGTHVDCDAYIGLFGVGPGSVQTKVFHSPAHCNTVLEHAHHPHCSRTVRRPIINDNYIPSNQAA